MSLLLPFVLACCYEYYAGPLKRRSANRMFNAVYFLLLTLVLWLLQAYARENVHWLLEPFLYYGAPFFYLWGSRRCPAPGAFYHTVILFLSIDSIVRGLGHLSMVLFNQDYIYYTSPLPLHLLFTLVLTGLVLGTLWLVRRLVFAEERPVVTAAQVVLMLLTLLPVLYLTNIHQWLGIDRTTVGLDASVVRMIISLCGLAAILGNESLYRSRLQSQELAAMEAMLHSQYEQFLLKKESSERIMQQCHDLKNQFRILQASSDTGLRVRYMEELQRTINQYDSLYQTGNETLDNAIEGLLPVADPDLRRIQVRMTQENSLLFIRFENPYEHELHWEGSRLATTKTDEAGHGYGLKGIGYAARKYQGHVTIDAADGKFALTVMLARPAG